MARVLVPVADGFEEIEAVTAIDILRRAEVEVVVAGLAPGPATTTHRRPVPAPADPTLAVPHAGRE